LLLIKELVETGKYRPVIDRGYEIEDVIEAVRYVETARRRATSCSASATRLRNSRDSSLWRRRLWPRRKRLEPRFVRTPTVNKEVRP
jgi:hypothetical protein